MFSNISSSDPSELQNETSAQTGSTAPKPTLPPLHSGMLLCGQKQVEILHNGSLYKLQATKLGKLILTK